MEPTPNLRNHALAASIDCPEPGLLRRAGRKLGEWVQDDPLFRGLLTVILVVVLIFGALFLASCTPAVSDPIDSSPESFTLDMRDPQAIRNRALAGGWVPERRFPELLQARVMADCRADTEGYPAGVARHPKQPDWLTAFCTFGRPIKPVEAESICAMVPGPGWTLQSYTEWTVTCRPDGPEA